MKLHTIIRSTTTGNPLTVGTAGKTQTFEIAAPAEGVLMRMNLIAEDDPGNASLTVDLLDRTPASGQTALHRIIPQQTMAAASGLFVNGLYAYSNTYNRTISGTTLQLVITGTNDIPKDTKFAVCLVIEVSGARM